MTQILKRNATNVIRVLEYTDDVTGLAVTNATVLGTLYTQEGVAVTGATDIAMPHFVAAGAIPAQYRGIIPSTVALPAESYDLRAIATNPDGVRPFNDVCIVEDG